MQKTQNVPDMEALAAEAAGLPPPTLPEGRLEKMQALAERVCVIDEQVEELERRLKERKVARYEILTRDLPELMDVPGAEVDSVTVRGREFRPVDAYHASIKVGGPREAEAYDWLEAHGAGDLVKREVTFSFGRDAEREARALREYVAAHADVLAEYLRLSLPEGVNDFDAATSAARLADAAACSAERRTVPWSRLTSWLEEAYALRRGGQDVPIPPLDLIGATVERVVKIKEPKARSRR